MAELIALSTQLHHFAVVLPHLRLSAVQNVVFFCFGVGGFVVVVELLCILRLLRFKIVFVAVGVEVIVKSSLPSL